MPLSIANILELPKDWEDYHSPQCLLERVFDNNGRILVEPYCAQDCPADNYRKDNNVRNFYLRYLHHQTPAVSLAKPLSKAEASKNLKEAKILQKLRDKQREEKEKEKLKLAAEAAQKKKNRRPNKTPPKFNFGKWLED